MNPDDPMDRLRDSVADDATMAPRSADRLEASLRVAHAARAMAAAPAWRRPIALGAVATVVLLVALATFVIRDTAPTSALVLTDAHGVTITLPDGSLVVDPADGFTLPDGAVVAIADGGRATIDDTIFDVESTLMVRDGVVVSRVDVTTTSASDIADATTTTPTDVTTTTTAPADDGTTTTVADASPTTTVSPTTTTPPDRDRGRDDRPAPTTKPEPDDGERGGRGHDDPPVDTVDIALELVLVDGGVRVEWNVAGLADGWQVVVYRRVGDGPLEVVVGPTSESSGSVVDSVAGAGDGADGHLHVRYRVRVLDETGTEIGSGPSRSVRR